FAGVIAFALVATAISFQLLQSYTIGRARADLRREAAGLTRIYTVQSTGSNDQLQPHQLENATGDRIFYVPVEPGIGIGQPLHALRNGLIDFAAVARGKTVEFDLKLPGSNKTWLAVAQPLNLGKPKGGTTFFGALVVAKPKNVFAVAPLLGRVALALLGG